MITSGAVAATGVVGGSLVSSAVASAPIVDTKGEDFIRLQKWFRDHPDLLWGAPFSSRAETVRQKAARASETFRRANPHIDYDTVVDRMTDNVVMKVYTKWDGSDVGLASAITRYAIERDDEIDGVIADAWSALTEAANQRPIPSDWQDHSGRWPSKTIMNMTQAKSGLR